MDPTICFKNKTKNNYAKYTKTDGNKRNKEKKQRERKIRRRIGWTKLIKKGRKEDKKKGG